MSDYEYTHKSSGGPDLLISEYEGSDSTIWIGPSTNGAIGSYIERADVPTVALELLKAAGRESVIVPKSTEKVSNLGGLLECGVRAARVQALETYNPANLRAQAANSIALAEYIESTAAREAAEKAEAEAAEKKLQERRDAVLKETGIYDSYESLGPNAPMRRAVDRIIELGTILEDGAPRD